MKIFRLLPLLFAGGALAIGEARAVPLYFDLSGTFDSAVPTTPVSAPNTTFDLQFSLPEDIASAPGFSLSPETDSFLVGSLSESFTLGNNPPLMTSTGYVQFYASTASYPNEFFVYFRGLGRQDSYGFVLYPTSQIYSGPLSDPTIVPDTYTAATWIPEVSNEKLVISTSPIVNSVPDGASTFVLLGMGCLGMVCVRSKLRSPTPKAATV